MQYRIITLAIFFCVTAFANIFSQSDTIRSTNVITTNSNTDSKSSKIEEHSPHKATVYSAILPGLGQAYNKSYWKIPVIYAGFGTAAYFVYTNKKEYKLFKDAYIYVANGSTGESPNNYAERYNQTQLKTAKDTYRYNLELSYIIGGFIYLLNIIEAAVDAQFYDFDVSDDLSLRIEPQIRNNALNNHVAPGLSLSINF